MKPPFSPRKRRFLLFLGILLFLNYGVARLSDLLAYQMWPRDVDTAVFIVFGSAVLYVVLMALPFMPGIEIGLMLMAMLGVGGIVLVYLCTGLALSLSFLAVRFLPPRYIARANVVSLKGRESRHQFQINREN